MSKILIILTVIFQLSFLSFSNVKFSSDSISIHFPNIIIASGNANFYNDEINIDADHFFYDTNDLKGSFKRNVKINYEKSILSGEELFLNLKSKEISGKGNIILKTHGFNATSDNLIIRDYKLAYLKDNVKIKRNGSQISSNELIYSLETDTIISTQRVKLKFEQ